MMKYLALLCVVFLIVPATVIAQEDAAVFPTLIEQIDALEEDTMELRGLDELYDVERLFPTREEAIAYITGEIETELADAVGLEMNQFYRAFDFIGPDVDIVEVYIELLADQIAGFYDPDSEQMNVLLISDGELGDYLPAFEQVIYSHEYVHALQDQHFDLGGFDKSYGEIEEYDAYLAGLSLVEGDATLAMQQFSTQAMQENPDFAIELMQAAANVNSDMPEGTPPILEAELMMPYLNGMAFVSNLYNQGGWEAVNAAYDNLPQSTEQILHPERYFQGDMPIAVAVTSVSHILGNDWLEIRHQTLGEFYLRQYLLTQISGSDARDATTGWGGDSYRLYYNEQTDQRTWIMRLVWDTPQDGGEFVKAYIEFADLRMATIVDEAEVGEFMCWHSVEQNEALCMINRDGTVIAYAPTWQMAVDFIAAQ